MIWHLLCHWGWLMHICVSKIILIGSNNGLSTVRCQAIIWTNAGIFLIETWGMNFSEILTEINIHSRKCISNCLLPNGIYFIMKHESSLSLAFVGESTGDWWIPFTQIRLITCFHLIMSSCSSMEGQDNKPFSKSSYKLQPRFAAQVYQWKVHIKNGSEFLSRLEFQLHWPN